jgi:hypothetical protein
MLTGNKSSPALCRRMPPRSFEFMGCEIESRQDKDGSLKKPALAGATLFSSTCKSVERIFVDLLTTLGEHSSIKNIRKLIKT